MEFVVFEIHIYVCSNDVTTTRNVGDIGCGTIYHFSAAFTLYKKMILTGINKSIMGTK